MELINTEERVLEREASSFNLEDNGNDIANILVNNYDEELELLLREEEILLKIKNELNNALEDGVSGSVINNSGVILEKKHTTPLRIRKCHTNLKIKK
jgi:hypothetical protein